MGELRTVAVLYADPKGPYPKMPGCDVWDEARDARLYEGPHPVVAHPPCAAWCQLAGVREARYGYPRGQDGGLFRRALEQLRAHGGVLEHPAYSKAWPAHGLTAPTPGAWTRCAFMGLWSAQVSQCAYGHRARKRTWLLLCGGDPPDTDWSEPYQVGSICISGAKNHHLNPGQERMWTREAKRTPPAFAEFLVSLARRCNRPDQ